MTWIFRLLLCSVSASCLAITPVSWPVGFNWPTNAPTFAITDEGGGVVGSKVQREPHFAVDGGGDIAHLFGRHDIGAGAGVSDTGEDTGDPFHERQHRDVRTWIRDLGKLGPRGTRWNGPMRGILVTAE
jgi:hypothetical protein